MNHNGLYPLLERAAKNWPNDTAISSALGDFTFAQLDAAAQSLAAHFRDAGIEPGHKVGILCPSGPSYVIASFALFRVDGIVVPIFPGLKPSEVGELAAGLEINAVCFDPQYKDLCGDDSLQQAVALPRLAGAIDFHLMRYGVAGLGKPPDNRLVKIGAPLLRFTSGTTSAAKGVIIPQPAMLEYTRRFSQSYAIEKGDGVLNLLSMAHIFYQITAGLLQGARIIVYEVNDRERIVAAIQAGQISHIEAAPSFYAMLLQGDTLSAQHFARVKYITSCGAVLSDHVAAKFREKFGREIVQRYGLTETGPVIINLNEDPSKRGTLGRPAFGCEIKLATLDSEVTDESEGEILVRCPGLFSGYYSPWTPAETMLDGGWYHTGDVAAMDSEGYFRIVGRTKNIINVGAVKVFPTEIEQILCTHPAVEEALVYGAPDPRFGEAPRAKVKLKPDACCDRKELLAFVNQQLSLFAALRDLDYVDALPKTVSGKLKRSGV
jgi:acyl-CoA synthetase (AMP-forming)/AMP-acid ligase II